MGLVAGGFWTGWWARGLDEDNPSAARSGGQGPQVAAWQLRSVPVGSLCKGKAQGSRSLLKPTRKGPLPPRMSDHLLDQSPLPVYELATEGPLSVAGLTRPWEKALPAFGAVRGYAQSFNSPDKPGGFGMTVFEFANGRAALAGAGAAFSFFVCEYGADPFTIRGRQGIAVGVLPTDHTIGWWVHGRRLVQTSYAMYGEPSVDRTEALRVLRAGWDVGSTDAAGPAMG
jgi:hypothetical protein